MSGFENVLRLDFSVSVVKNNNSVSGASEGGPGPCYLALRAGLHEGAAECRK